MEVGFLRLVHGGWDLEIGARRLGTRHGDDDGEVMTGDSGRGEGKWRSRKS